MSDINNIINPCVHSCIHFVYGSNYCLDKEVLELHPLLTKQYITRLVYYSHSFTCNFSVDGVNVKRKINGCYHTSVVGVTLMIGFQEQNLFRTGYLIEKNRKKPN